jgi:DHA1 family bicyclomycin/chloramphenicol resistance-like MFS transporter
MGAVTTSTIATAPPPTRSVPAALVAVVVFLTAVAPLSTDMYVTAFPSVEAGFGTSTSAVQLTLTTFFVGMGLGQLVGGPYSDQRGRRLPLLAGTVLVVAASVVCALAPSIGVLMVARLLQGFGGGWVMVVARAVIVDLAHGTQLVRVLNVVMGIGGIAPVLGPLFGAAILGFGDWRTTFWVLAALGVLMFVAAAVVVPESLPRDRRHAGGLRTFRRAARQLIADRRFVGYVVTACAAFVGVFAYVATSPFILQTMNGLSPTAYAIDFAANAGAMTIASLVAARLAGRVSTRRIILVGQGCMVVAGSGMLVGAVWFGMPLVVALVGFFVLMVGNGLVVTNGGALASSVVPEHPGTSSAVLGLVQWTTAGLAAPVAGLGGSDTAVPMAVLVLGGALVSLSGLLVLARPHPPVSRPVPERTTP